ncbi:MAG: hypothetical protein ACOZAH_03575 [Pseudomonadota bacterium]
MATPESGARWGWIGGFVGATLWMPILAVALHVHGDPLGAWLGMGFYLLSLLGMVMLAPWRHPATPMRWLYLGMLGLLLLAGGVLMARMLALWPEEELSPWLLLSLAPLFLPVLTLGDRTWSRLREGG